jgi:hypothetical protein
MTENTEMQRSVRMGAMTVSSVVCILYWKIDNCEVIESVRGFVDKQ